MGAFAIGLSHRGNEDAPLKKREAFFKSKDAKHPSTGQVRPLSGAPKQHNGFDTKPSCCFFS
jgi:hypothetical protein